MRSLGDSHAACKLRPKANPLLIACRVLPFVGALHAAHIAHATAAGPGPVAYVLLVPAPSQGLVEPAVRVCVRLSSRGQVERYSINFFYLPQHQCHMLTWHCAPVPPAS